LIKTKTIDDGVGAADEAGDLNCDDKVVFSMIMMMN